MGDAEKEVEEELVSEEIRADVLKIGHHGSNTSTTENFINMVDPLCAIISTSGEDKNPDIEVLERLKDTNVFRTDINGNVVIKSNGEEIYAYVEKNTG